MSRFLPKLDSAEHDERIVDRRLAEIGPPTRRRIAT
jgi:hypothetical protein